VVEETKDGLIVRGAKMLATHGPTADELLIYPQPGIRDGEEKYVSPSASPALRRVLRFICASRSTTETIGLGPSARRAL
jgi:aromatic ring hydroxylase